MCNLIFYSLRYELSKYVSIIKVACLEQKLMYPRVPNNVILGVYDIFCDLKLE